MYFFLFSDKLMYMHLYVCIVMCADIYVQVSVFVFALQILNICLVLMILVFYVQTIIKKRLCNTIDKYLE